MPKVSIIVPIYNAEQYLHQCLESVISQTLKDIEIILIDDGSKDNSATICQEYLKDSRVSFFHKENEGLAAARRDGMGRATGEYIGFVDSDDWLEPDMYEKMYSAAQTNHADIVFCNCIENENGHRFTPEMPSGPYNREQIKEHIIPRTLAYIDKNGGMRVIRWCNWLRIYRHEYLKKINFCFDGRFRRSQDLQLTYEATLYAQNYYYLGDDYLYHNRVVGDSLSRGYTKNMWPLYRNLIDRLYQDTENFKEMDLMPQMHLRNFFFVCQCIDNEFKPSCPNDFQTRIRLIQEIVDDEHCRLFQGKIPVDKLNELLQGYYKLILRHDAKGFFRFRNKIQRKQNFINHIWKPIVDWLTEGKVTGTLYKKIRGK